MKNKRLLFQTLALICATTFFTACDKIKDKPADDFDVSISSDGGETGNSIEYTSALNTIALISSPTVEGGSENLWIGKTEVTYKLWKEVYDWAIQNGYSLTSKGQPGSDENFSHDHPVTSVSWRDAVVWSNAFTEFYNEHNGDKPDYSYAYTYGGSPVKNSDLDNENLESLSFNTSATGFRIPTNAEWYAAAAYGNSSENYPSGASDEYSNAAACNAVAWYRDNSNMESHPVAQKQANHLGIYDMSGNVSEVVFDKAGFNGEKYNNKGGAWNSNPDMIAVGAHFPLASHTSSYSMGFRIVRTAGNDDHEDFGSLSY